jgi:HK97 family phage portal protein
MLRRGLETRSLRPIGWSRMDPSAIPPNSEAGGRYAAGQVVTERSSLQVAAVMACVRVIAFDIAGLPLDAFRKEGRRRIEVTPTPSIVDDPFGYDITSLVPFSGWTQVLVSLLLRGNSFNYVLERNALGYPTSVLPIHPDLVTGRVENSRKVFTVNGRTVPTEDIVHIPGLMLPGSQWGMSVIDYNARSIGVSLATDEYGDRYFGQGTIVSGVLQSEQPINEETARQTAQRIAKKHGGVHNAHLPLILGNGLKWQSLTVAPNEAQFLETRAMNRSEIAMIFGIPPHLIGHLEVKSSQGGGKGLEQQDLGYVTHTLRGWVIPIEQHWTQLIPTKATFARFNLDALLRADLLTRYQSYQIGRNLGFINNDWITDTEDLPPIPGGAGADYQQPLNSAHSDPVVAAGDPGTQE